MDVHVEESRLHPEHWLLVVDGEYFPFPSRASAERAVKTALEDPEKTGFLAALQPLHPISAAIQRGDG